MCLSVFWWSNWLPPAPNGNSILTPSKVKNSGPSFTKRWRNISHSCFLILFWKLQNTKPSSESFVSDHHYKCWNLQRLYISYMTAYKTSYIISQPCIKNKNWNAMNNEMFYVWPKAATWTLQSPYHLTRN